MNKLYTHQRLPTLLHRYLLQTMMIAADPFWKQITIQRLTMRQDLHVAHVFYTFFGKWPPPKVAQLLACKLPALKHGLSQKWPYRRLPRLVFVLDRTTLKQDQVWTALNS